MFPFYTPCKHQEALGFLVFSEDIEWEHGPEMRKDTQALRYP